MYSWRELVVAGGLHVLWAEPAYMHRRAAIYVDKILKGAKPATSPSNRPTKFEFVINLKDRQALGSRFLRVFSFSRRGAPVGSDSICPTPVVYDFCKENR